MQVNARDLAQACTQSVGFLHSHSIVHLHLHFFLLEIIFFLTQTTSKLWCGTLQSDIAPQQVCSLRKKLQGA